MSPLIGPTTGLAADGAAALRVLERFYGGAGGGPGGEWAESALERKVLGAVEMVVEAVLPRVVDGELAAVHLDGFGGRIWPGEHQVTDRGGRALGRAEIGRVERDCPVGQGRRQGDRVGPVGH